MNYGEISMVFLLTTMLKTGKTDPKNTRMNRWISSWVVSVVVLVLSHPANAISQEQKNRQLFTADDFIRQVKQYHPVAKQASIGVEKADYALLSARGGFDPA